MVNMVNTGDLEHSNKSYHSCLSYQTQMYVTKENIG